MMFFSIGILRIADILVYVILYTSLLRLDGHLIVSAFIALILAEVILVLSCAPCQETPCRQAMGLCTLDTVLVLAALHLFFHAGLLLRLVHETLEDSYRDSTLECSSAMDGVSDRQTDHPCLASAGLRLERGEHWQRLRGQRFAAVSHLREL